MNPLDCTYLDGPKVVEWLEERGLLEPSRTATVGDSFTSRLGNWESGAAAEVFTVDEVLCRLGVCLGELPDEFYREPPVRPGGAQMAIGPEMVARIRELAESDEKLTYTQIGELVGCSRRTVGKYLERMGVGD